MPAIRLTKHFLCILVILASLTVTGTTTAEPIHSTEFTIISDSEENFDRRIYSYDMDVENDGTVHIVYLQPTNNNSAQIIYKSRRNGQWDERIICSHALRGSLSTNIIVDDNKVAHISYIGDDNNLFYVTVTNDVVGRSMEISPGAWHTRMQLAGNNQPVFIREGENWRVTPHISKLVIVTTPDNGNSWNERYIDIELPAGGNKFRLADFILKNGKYHVTFGDNYETRQVLSGVGSTQYINGIFHRFCYSTSSDGLHWQTDFVESAPYLYEMEFWTALDLDGDNPIIALYHYQELNNQYNTGTSAWVYKKTGSTWTSYRATPSDYAATREGMGAGIVVRGANDYLGAWDLSPDNTHDDDFRGARGNIAIRLNGQNNSWEQKRQLATFSAEGKVLLKVKNNRLYVLALGDHVDAKLYFWEIDSRQLYGEASSGNNNQWDQATATLTLRGIDIAGSDNPDQSAVFAVMKLEDSTAGRLRFRLTNADWDSEKHEGIFYPDTHKVNFKIDIDNKTYDVWMEMEQDRQGSVYFTVTSIDEQ